MTTKSRHSKNRQKKKHSINNTQYLSHKFKILNTLAYVITNDSLKKKTQLRMCYAFVKQLTVRIHSIFFL